MNEAHGQKLALRDPDLIRSEIDRAREDIARSLGALRKRMEQASDWRAWVGHGTWLWIGAAIAVGVAIGLRRKD